MSWSGVPFPGTQPQPFTTPAGGQVSEGSITYTTSTGPDGRIMYHPFRAVPASYQTSSGIVTGIQWVPAEATQVLPTGAQPANAEFVASWNRGDVSREQSKLIKEWQREEEKRRKKEEKDAAKRLKDRRDQDSELRRARERDAQTMHNLERKRSFNAPSNPGVGPYGGYPLYDQERKYTAGTSDLARGLGDLDLDRDRGGFERERKVSFNADGGLGRPRKYSVGAPEKPRRLSNVGGERPAVFSPTAGSPGSYGTGVGAYPASAFAGRASPNMRPTEPQYLAGASGYPGPFPPSPNRVPLGDPIARSTSPYKNPQPQVYPKGHVLEGQPIGPRSRAASPIPGGPNEFPQPAVRGGMGGASPLIGGSTLSGSALPLEAPVGFSRAVNAAQSYTPFETMKIQNMDDFLERIPRMPLVLQPHDVYHEDWIRLMQDLSRAWQGNLPVRDVGRSGHPPKRSTLVRDLIDLWNLNFFLRRGVEVVLYKGRERRSGPKIGVVDLRPDYDDEDDDSSSTASSEDSELSGEERVMAQEYGVYGRQPVGQMTEMLEARRRRRESKAEKKRRSREKRLRRRAREKERQYALYLTCVIPVDGSHGGLTGLGGGHGSSIGGYAAPHRPSSAMGHRPSSAMGHGAPGSGGYPTSGGYGSNYRD